MWKELKKKPFLQTLPMDWFPDRAAVRAFVQGPNYYALAQLVLGVTDGSLPEPLASNAHGAAYFVGADLFELARVAALPGEESFEYTEMEGGCSCEWKERIFLLGTIALAQGFVKEIFEPIIAMQAEAEKPLSDRHQAQLAASARDGVQCFGVLVPTRRSLFVGRDSRGPFLGGGAALPRNPVARQAAPVPKQAARERLRRRSGGAAGESAGGRGRSRRFEWRFRGNAARDSLAIRGLGGQEIAKPLDGLFPADDALVHQHR